MSEFNERALLHSILIDNGMMEFTKGLSRHHFQVDIHNYAFGDMQDRYADGIPFNAQNLTAEPKTQAYLALLTEGVAHPKFVQRHVEEIIEQYKLEKFDKIAKSGKSSAECLKLIEAEFQNSGPNLRRELLIPAARFCCAMPQEIEWVIEGIIPAGSNGIISGEPKASKTWIADELSLSVASATPFLGKESFRVPRPLKTALIAREDYPGLTAWRLGALYRSRKWPNPEFFVENLLVNTRAQSDSLNVDNSEEIEEIISTLKRHKIQFAIFDVLNILHSSDENDNTEMRQVMNKFSYIQTKTGAQIALVHHLGKQDGKWTRRLRGASSIHGWVEWLIGVTEVDEQSRIRKMEFELKAGEAPEPIFYRIESEKGSNLALIRVCDGPSSQTKWT